MISFDEFLDKYEIAEEPLMAAKEEEFVFTTIYKGKNKATSEEVIVKVFQLINANKGGAFSNFITAKKQLEEEIRIMLSLKDNPYVVSIKEYYADFMNSNKEAFIAMEYVGGISIGQHVKNHGKLSADEFYKFAFYFIEAMDSIHKLGIIHRDISINNVFVNIDHNGSITGLKLIDFGSAFTKRFGVRHKLMFTPNCAPPESCNSIITAIDKRYDIYSFGAVLYYALTGEFPYGIDILTDKSQEKYFKPIDRYDIPSDIEKFIESCIKFNRMDRPSSLTFLRGIISKL